MRTTSNSEHQLRELSMEELDAVIENLGGIEVPEGSYTNSGEKCAIVACTFAVDDLGHFRLKDYTKY